MSSCFHRMFSVHGASGDAFRTLSYLRKPSHIMAPSLQPGWTSSILPTRTVRERFRGLPLPGGPAGISLPFDPSTFVRLLRASLQFTGCYCVSCALCFVLIFRFSRLIPYHRRLFIVLLRSSLRSTGCYCASCALCFGLIFRFSLIIDTGRGLFTLVVSHCHVGFDDL